jgi:hypothetical protein
LIRDPLGLGVAVLAACVLVLVGVKTVKLLGKEERDMLGSVPIPAADRIWKLLG